MMQKFFATNTAISENLERRVGWQSDKPFWRSFETRVQVCVAASEGAIVDLGGGGGVSGAGRSTRKPT